VTPREPPDVVETVRFPLEGGGDVLVRVDCSDQYEAVVTRGGREYIQRAVEQAGQSFESALGTIRLVAAAGAGAQLRVALTWNRKESDHVAQGQPSATAAPPNTSDLHQDSA
jgi:hypothetical protein